MGQTKAAAQRKIGIQARGYYLVCGFIVALYVYFYSLDQVFVIWDDFKNIRDSRSFTFTLEGRQILQQTVLFLASICASWYVLTGTRYSYFTVNGSVMKIV